MYRAYLRCSTDKQTLERQELQLKQWLKENKVSMSEVKIYREKRSGKNTERPVLKEVMEDLQAGDCLLLCELSRAHRNMENVRKMWQELSERNVYIVVMNYKMLDTRPKENDTLANQLIVNIMLDVLAFVTEEERLSILERTQAGREAAEHSGKTCHRPQLTKDKLPKEFIKVWTANKNILKKQEILTLVNAELRKAQKPEIKSRVTFDKYIKLLEK